MTTKRIFTKYSKVMLGLLGVTALLSSCAKEKTCECSVTVTYTDGGQTYTYSYKNVVEITAKSKDCEDVELEFSDVDPSASYTASCKEK